MKITNTHLISWKWEEKCVEFVKSLLHLLVHIRWNGSRDGVFVRPELGPNGGHFVCCFVLQQLQFHHFVQGLFSRGAHGFQSFWFGWKREVLGLHRLRLLCFCLSFYTCDKLLWRCPASDVIQYDTNNCYQVNLLLKLRNFVSVFVKERILRQFVHLFLAHI